MFRIFRDLDGTIIGVLGTYEDITEEKRREERERQLQAEVRAAKDTESPQCDRGLP